MSKHNILNQTDCDRVLKAIQDAEKGNTAQIRVHIQRKIIGTVMDEAKKKFEELEMHHNPRHNSILIYIAKEDHFVAVLGDTEVCKVVSDNFWQETIDKMKPYLQKYEISEAVEAGTQHIGQTLKQFFPLPHSNSSTSPESK